MGRGQKPARGVSSASVRPSADRLGLTACSPHPGTGDAQLDGLIEGFRFKADECEWHDGDVAPGQCYDAAYGFEEHCRVAGIPAEAVYWEYSTFGGSTLDWADEENGETGNEVNEDNEHMVTRAQLNGQEWLIDWTAIQYGFSDFPHVQRLSQLDETHWGYFETDAVEMPAPTEEKKWHEDPDRADWQHGMCDTYALALLELHPQLRMGSLHDPVTEVDQHYFAHDDQYAYDSIGRHPLPYKGVEGRMEQRLDERPSHYFGDGEGNLYYPHGENGGPEDYERAKTLIAQQHPWLAAKTTEPFQEPALTLVGGRSSKRPVQVLPPGFADSLRAPELDPVPKPRKQPPLMVNPDGTLHPDAYAVLAALEAQSAAQAARKDWNGSRVPNGMVEPPEGMSVSKYKKNLTPLRAAGLVKSKQGLWWVLPEGRVVLAAGQGI